MLEAEEEAKGEDGITDAMADLMGANAPRVRPGDMLQSESTADNDGTGVDEQ